MEELFNYFKLMFDLAIAGETKGIFFYSALYFLIILNYSVITQILIGRWPSTPGDLSFIGAKKFGPNEWATVNQDYRSKAQYSYSVDGIKYIGHRVSPWVMVVSHSVKSILETQLKAVEYLPNGRVNVYYSPNNPQKSYLIPTRWKSQLFTFILSLIPIVLFWQKYYG